MCKIAESVKRNDLLQSLEEGLTSWENHLKGSDIKSKIKRFWKQPKSKSKKFLWGSYAYI